LKGITVTHGHSSSTNMTTIKAGTTTTTAFSVEQDTTGDLVFQAGTATPLTIANTGQVNIADTAAFKVPVGGMNSRPATPANGMLRYNSDFEEFEGYSNSKWNLLTLSSMKLKLDFDETTTLPAGISFTRATSGTFFNSSGVLTTAGSGVARFDHRLEGGIWKNKGLLIEEQRTNLVQRSEEFNDSYWTKNNISVTTNATTAPDGTTTAERFLETTSVNVAHIVSRDISENLTSTPYTFSLFLKSNGRTKGVLQLTRTVSPFDSATTQFDLATEQVFALQNNAAVNLGSSITKLNDGWYRLTVSGYTGHSSSNQIRLVIYSDSNEFNYTGDSNKGYFIWGAQLEAGAFPTSYIATTSASVTRNADVASMTSTNFSSWYNATEGIVFWQGDLIGLKGSSTRLYSISDNTSNEYMQGNASNSSGNGFTFAVFDGGVLQAVLNTPNPLASPSINTTYKHAVAYKVNDFSASRDGGTVSTDVSGTLPTVNRLYLGLDEVGTGTGVLNGHIAKFYYWNTRLSNNFLRDYTKT